MAKRGKCGIMFVHGIVGNTRIFDFLRSLVPEEYEVRKVTLHGHGSDALAFSRASMDSWKAQVEECADELSAICGTVVAVGHSMGCLLLLGEAAAGRVSRLFMMNPPMQLSLKPRLLMNSLKVLTGLTDNDPVAAAAKEAYGISLDFNPLHYYGWPARYAELFNEIHRTRKHVLAKVNCPLVVLLSRLDEMVSPSSANSFMSMPNARVVELPTSTHYYYSGPDRDLIIRHFKEFISGNN